MRSASRIAWGLVFIGAAGLAACSSNNNNMTGSAGTTGAAGAAGAAAGSTGTAGAGGAAGAAGGGGSAACTRATLTAATQALAQALTTADATKLPLATNATYHENLQTPSFTQAIWTAPLTIAHQRDFLDVTLCQTFSEIVVTAASHPYVMGFRLTLAAGKVSDVTSLVADAGDFHFDAMAFFNGTSTEDWSVVPEAMRPTREAVIAAGNAYYDYFNDRSIVVPVAPTCIRLEGTNNDPCLEALPPVGRVQVTMRTPLVDETLGTAVFIDRFRGLPDTHIFRMVGGQITHMHAIIICDPTCAPPAMDGGTDGATDASGSAGAGGAGGAGGGGGAGGAAGAAGAGGTGGAAAGGAGGAAGAAGAAGASAAGSGGRGGAGGSG
jgi:hypothetical protein